MVGGPIAGRHAVLRIGGKTVAKLRNVTVEASQDIIKDYSMESTSPAVSEPGEVTYTFRAEKLWVDSVWVNSMLAQTSPSGWDLELYPAGTGSGELKLVLEDVLFTRYRISSAMDGAALENIEGEGMSLSTGKAA